MRLGLCASPVFVFVDQMITRAAEFVSSLVCIVHPKLLPAAWVRTSAARPPNVSVVTPLAAMVKPVLETSPLMPLDTE
jgi:hypothetical protein